MSSSRVTQSARYPIVKQPRHTRVWLAWDALRGGRLGHKPSYARSHSQHLFSYAPRILGEKASSISKYTKPGQPVKMTGTKLQSHCVSIPDHIVLVTCFQHGQPLLCAMLLQSIPSAIITKRTLAYRLVFHSCEYGEGFTLDYLKNAQFCGDLFQENSGTGIGKFKESGAFSPYFTLADPATLEHPSCWRELLSWKKADHCSAAASWSLYIEDAPLLFFLYDDFHVNIWLVVKCMRNRAIHVIHAFFDFLTDGLHMLDVNEKLGEPYAPVDGEGMRATGTGQGLLGFDMHRSSPKYQKD
ncbi:hypothetical protein DEU56DRAFT_761262 [Suillus clintonianus]|uniref:uncharacterized protein n=1 Tax=Suillus clintonianus TaxID=1904413 RepID=UPI001B882B60|nr:uncharacterized protein DEU56DRAFT_761262 [Suillus clintonianus]KAG2118382.1 hypothetical protein DEU56DRAFT_761262 [Suillus clintonianus]